nr:MAG TPA: hypothetical protein [Caudoviricetes sp.]
MQISFEALLQDGGVRSVSGFSCIVQPCGNTQSLFDGTFGAGGLRVDQRNEAMLFGLDVLDGSRSGQLLSLFQHNSSVSGESFFRTLHRFGDGVTERLAALQVGKFYPERTVLFVEDSRIYKRHTKVPFHFRPCRFRIAFSSPFGTSLP